MSELSPNNSLADAQLWARFGKAVIGRARSRALSIPQRRRDRQPDALVAAGKELLSYLVEQAPESGRFAIQTNSLNVPQRQNGCPVLAARDGFENDLLSVQLIAENNATAARLNLLQSHVKSYQTIFIAHEFEVSPDGAVSHLRIPLRLKYRDPGMAPDFTHSAAGMESIDMLIDHVLLGDLIDASGAQHAIDRFYGTVALMNGTQPPEFPDVQATTLAA